MMSSNDDFWPDEDGDMFDDGYTPTIALIFLCITFPSNIIFNGIIFIHGFSDQGSRSKILFRRLASYLSLAILFIGVVFGAIKMFRMIQGPANFLSPVCPVLNAILMVIYMICVLTFCEIIILRYLHICVWKHIGLMHEDFFSAFLPALNFFLGFYLASAMMYGELMRHYINRPWCDLKETGKDKIVVGKFVGLFTLVLHVYILTAIYSRKRNIEKSEGSGDKSKAKRELFYHVIILTLVVLSNVLFFAKKRVEGFYYKLVVILADIVVTPFIFTFAIPVLYILSNQSLMKYAKKRACFKTKIYALNG